MWAGRETVDDAELLVAPRSIKDGWKAQVLVRLMGEDRAHGEDVYCRSEANLLNSSLWNYSGNPYQILLHLLRLGVSAPPVADPFRLCAGAFSSLISS